MPTVTTPEPYDQDDLRRIRDALLLLRDRCGTDTFSLSTVAQTVTGRKKYWRALMPAVRAEAEHMTREGMLGLYRNGRPIAPSMMRGVVRAGLPDGRSARLEPEEAAKTEPA